MERSKVVKYISAVMGPVGCYLRKLSDNTIVAYLFLNSKVFLPSFTGYIMDFHGVEVYADYVGIVPCRNDFDGE